MIERVVIEGREWDFAQKASGAWEEVDLDVNQMAMRFLNE
jgi:hypothetical protein